VSSRTSGFSSRCSDLRNKANRSSRRRGSKNSQNSTPRDYLLKLHPSRLCRITRNDASAVVVVYHRAISRWGLAPSVPRREKTRWKQCEKRNAGHGTRSFEARLRAE